MFSHPFIMFYSLLQSVIVIYTDLLSYTLDILVNHFGSLFNLVSLFLTVSDYLSIIILCLFKSILIHQNQTCQYLEQLSPLGILSYSLSSKGKLYSQHLLDIKDFLEFLKYSLHLCLVALIAEQNIFSRNLGVILQTDILGLSTTII